VFKSRGRRAKKSRSNANELGVRRREASAHIVGEEREEEGQFWCPHSVQKKGQGESFPTNRMEAPSY